MKTLTGAHEAAHRIAVTLVQTATALDLNRNPSRTNQKRVPARNLREKKNVEASTTEEKAGNNFVLKICPKTLSF